MESRRLLIVEDDAAARAVMRQLFGTPGWEVITAGTVAEALGRLDPPPECILLDLMLPDGPGEEILRRVRQRGLGTRVVVTTAVGDPARLADLEALGADASFMKPLDLPAVRRVVATR